MAVLIVDDESESRTLLTAMLVENGYNIPAADRGESRSVQKPDLIESTGASAGTSSHPCEEIISSEDAKHLKSISVRSHCSRRMDEPEATACHRLLARRESSPQRAARYPCVERLSSTARVTIRGARALVTRFARVSTLCAPAKVNPRISRIRLRATGLRPVPALKKQHLRNRYVGVR